MRISDWSSDVCSSDLFDRGVGVVDIIIAQLLALHLFGLRDAARGGTGGKIERRLLMRILAIAQLGGQLGGQRQRVGRSEEHTSELQSLMRISYSVFCLKNKHHQPLTHRPLYT